MCNYNQTMPTTHNVTCVGGIVQPETMYYNRLKKNLKFPQPKNYYSESDRLVRHSTYIEKKTYICCF